MEWKILWFIEFLLAVNADISKYRWEKPLREQNFSNTIKLIGWKYYKPFPKPCWNETHDQKKFLKKLLTDFFIAILSNDIIDILLK